MVAFAQPVDHALAQSYLTPEQHALFCRMTRSEQQHSLRVLRAVLSQADETPHALAVAALLHDVGKTRYRMNLLARSLPVVVKKLAPRLEARLSANETPEGWHAPFVVRRHHPKWGAAMLCQTLCDKHAVWLVARHADPPAKWQQHALYPLLVRLQHADDAN
jgi:hypothetical protein